MFSRDIINWVVLYEQGEGPNNPPERVVRVGKISYVSLHFLHYYMCLCVWNQEGKIVWDSK